jgi:sugar lactone lactonase YvrE
MAREITGALLDDTGAELGEGPTWDAGAGCLVWVDILGGQVHLSEADGRPRTDFHVGRHVGAALPAEGGGWLLAVRDGFATLDPDGGLRTVVAVLADRPGMRFNDGRCDPRGRAFAGTMAYDQADPGARDAAALYRLDPGPSATPALGGLTLSNGLGWSPDGQTMYHIDSPTRTVRAFAYDLDRATMDAPRVVVEIDGPPGVVPDGMCVDHDGALWVAVWGRGAVHRYTPGGRLDTVVRLPVTQVTSCCFGGRAGDRLYVTSAREGLGPEQLAAQPLAGAVFVADPGATGPAATPWRRV